MSVYYKLMIREEMMLITTQNEFPDHKIKEVLGLVKGILSVRMHADVIYPPRAVNHEIIIIRLHFD